MLVKVVAEQLLLLLLRLCSRSGGGDAVIGEERSWIWWLFRGTVGVAAACCEVNSSRDVRRDVRRTIVTRYLGT